METGLLIVRSHIGWRGEWSILYKGVDTLVGRFEIVRLTVIRNGLK